MSSPATRRSERPTQRPNTYSEAKRAPRGRKIAPPALAAQAAGDEDEESSGPEVEGDVNDESAEEDDGYGMSAGPSTPALKRLKALAGDYVPSRPFIRPSSSDAYILAHSRPCPTSDARITQSLAPLTAAQTRDALEGSRALRTKHASETKELLASHEARFHGWTAELLAGFNLVFFGVGSKRKVLNSYATKVARRLGDVVVADGCFPGLTIKDVLHAIEERVSRLGNSAVPAGPLETRARRIHHYFASQPHFPSHSFVVKAHAQAKPRKLFIVVHNIDSPSLRTTRAQAIFSLLASCPHIHLLVSVDHINAPLMFGPEALARGSTRTQSREEEESEADGGGSPGVVDVLEASPGFNFLYHDLTTLLPYTYELSFSSFDHSLVSAAYSVRSSFSISSHVPGTASAAGHAFHPAAGGVGNQVIGEDAASHILRSVTRKAKNLFVRLATAQLESAAAPAPAGGQHDGRDGDVDSRVTGIAGADGGDIPAHAVSYASLLRVAKEQFLATSEHQFRSLLVEFRDHGLVVLAYGPGPGTAAVAEGDGGGDAGDADGGWFWVPMADQALRRVLASVQL